MSAVTELAEVRTVSGIKNVLTVLAVAINVFSFFHLLLSKKFKASFLKKNALLRIHDSFKWII